MYKSNSSSSKTLTFQSGRNGEAKAVVESSLFEPMVDNYANNMLITAVVEINDEELRSDDFELAAFVGNECRGSVRLMYVDPLDRYVAFLLVFGDTEENREVNVLMCGFGVGLSWGVMSAKINTSDIFPIIETDEYFAEGVIHSPEDM